MCTMVLVDGVLHGEGIAYVHIHLRTEGVRTVLRNCPVRTLGHFLIGGTGNHRCIAIAAHQRETTIDAEDILATLANHPLLTAKDIGDVSSVVACVMPLALCIAIL